jgi:protein involved in polysaccharide export with SLBB domain
MKKMLLLSVVFGGLCQAGAAEGPAQTGPAAETKTSQTPAASVETYKLPAGDRLTFQVEEDPAKLRESIELLVPLVGEVEFPVSRDDRSVTIALNVIGKTVPEVKTALKTALEGDYYQKATVKLRVSDPNQQHGQVAFWGAVRGLLHLDPNKPMKVSDGILQLGWDPMYANLKRVEVVRTDPVTRQKKTIIVNVQAILDKNGDAKDVILQDGDRVRVPEKGIILN